MASSSYYDLLSTFWKRRKRTILITLGAAGAVGVGAYCYYNYWRRTEYDVYMQDARRLAGLVEERERKVDTETPDESLQGHFESVQAICDSTTLPSFLPHLKHRLFELIHLSELTESLSASKQAPRGSMSIQEKMALWQQLTTQSFARTFSSLLSLSLLHLLLRVQLNMLGRRVFLQSAVRMGMELEPEDQSAATEPLSLSVQQRFIALSDHLPQEGLVTLVEDAQSAAEIVLKSASLKEECDSNWLHRTLHSLFLEFQDAHLNARKRRRREHRKEGSSGNAQEAPPSDQEAESPEDEGAKALGRHGEEGEGETPGEEAATEAAGERAAEGQGGKAEGLEGEGKGEEEEEVGEEEDGFVDWSLYLFPPEDQDEEGGGNGGEDADALRSLLREARHVLASDEFSSALASAVAAVSDVAVLSIEGLVQSRRPGGVTPLAKLLPPVANVGTSVLEVSSFSTLLSSQGSTTEGLAVDEALATAAAAADESRESGQFANPFLAALSSLPELRSLSAMVYTGGTVA